MTNPLRAESFGSVERTIAEMNAEVHTTEFHQLYQQLLADVMEQVWQHGYAVLKNGDTEILIDYRDR